MMTFELIDIVKLLYTILLHFNMYFFLTSKDLIMPEECLASLLSLISGFQLCITTLTECNTNGALLCKEYWLSIIYTS